MSAKPEAKSREKPKGPRKRDESLKSSSSSDESSDSTVDFDENEERGGETLEDLQPGLEGNMSSLRSDLDAGLEPRRKKAHNYLRETVDDPKGDTAVRFVPTRRGGVSALFRSFFFRISRKQGPKSYWRCQTRGCKVTLVIENELFKSVGGEHNHEPDEERKMERIEKKKEKLEKARAAREERMEKLKMKEEERKKREEEKAIKRATELQTTGASDLLSVESLLSMDTSSWNQNEFEDFDIKLVKLFNVIKSIQYEVEGISIESLLMEWEVIKMKVKMLSNKKSKKRDKKFQMLKSKLESLAKERDDAFASKKDLETSLSSLNVPGCQLLLNELSDIQRKYNIPSNDPSSATPVIEITGLQQVTDTMAMDGIPTQGNNVTIDYKAMYERMMKERDSLKMRLSQASQQQQVQVNQYQGYPHVHYTQQQTHPRNQQVATIVTTPLNSVQQHYSQMPNNSDLREPQILLVEGTQAQRLWSNNC